MIERCLIIHEFEDFSNVSKLHFPLQRGFLWLNRYQSTLMYPILPQARVKSMGLLN